jgi:hypothetical protein
MRLKAAQRRKAIDMKHSLQITAAMALCLAALHTATAGEPLHSPRGKAHAITQVQGVSPDRLDRSVQTVPPRLAALQQSLRTVSGQTADRWARHTPTAAPRLLNNEPWRLKEFHIAPLK